MSKIWIYLFMAVVMVVTACGPTKHVPQGSYLLHKVNVETDNKRIKYQEVKQYIRQTPNASALGVWKIPLSVYSLSGSDSSKWFNRWLRRAGNAPIIYDSLLQVRSEQEIEKALHNKGYLLAKVTSDVEKKKKKAVVTYKINASTPYRIGQIHHNIQDPHFASLIRNDSTGYTLHQNMILDRELLDKERQRITAMLRNNGYYNFDAELINFTADSTVGNKQVDLTINIKSRNPTVQTDSISFRSDKKYTINNVYIILEAVAYTDTTIVLRTDTTSFDGIHVVTTGVKWLDPTALANSCFIIPGKIYSDRMVNNTYSSFNRFPAIKYFNLSFKEFIRNDSLYLDCYMQLSEAKTTSITAELMGTNTAGDLGFAASAGYQNRNSFNKGEIFNVKIRGAYENISGGSTSYLANNYYEIGGETSLSFPKFMFPFLNPDFKKRVRATSEVAVNYNLQKRPEYTRIFTGGTWSYKWAETNSLRHTVDLLNVNFVNVPYIDSQFRDTLQNNPLLWQSFESHLIVGMGYRFIKTNQEVGRFKRNTYSIRAGFESAGNLLYLLSNVTNQKKKNDQYQLFGLPYSQYIRTDFDYIRSINFSPGNSLNFHTAFGMAVPYGNASIVPYEKLFYSGGANSVRGWSVRALGPGRYTPTFTNYDFANQLGDIRLDLSIEHRAKLLWKLESAIFFDAGNIWNLRNYSSPEVKASDEEAGVFKFSDFYKQLALAYGVGVRLNFDYFIIRVDWGFKLYDPAGTGRWVKPFSGRDNALHFAIGYPF